MEEESKKRGQPPTVDNIMLNIRMHTLRDILEKQNLCIRRGDKLWA
jgi:hypothetical protein